VDHVIRVGVIAAGTLLLAAALAGDRSSACPATVVPAYLPPDELSRLAARSSLPWLLVVNPDNGPGTVADVRYRRAVPAARAAGARVLGYVATTWGTRPAEAVKADIEHYRAWYAVDGIFFDEAAADESALPYYRALATGTGVVVLNPGVVPARGYFDIADVVVTFEGSFASYAERDEPRWLARERTAHLVYAAPRPEAAGRVYMTTGELPNPWATVATPSEACA
jgi:Spherulation-specific family 4